MALASPSSWRSPGELAQLDALPRRRHQHQLRAPARGTIFDFPQKCRSWISSRTPDCCYRSYWYPYSCVIRGRFKRRKDGSGRAHVASGICMPLIRRVWLRPAEPSRLAHSRGGHRLA